MRKGWKSIIGAVALAAAWFFPRPALAALCCCDNATNRVQFEIGGTNGGFSDDCIRGGGHVVTMSSCHQWDSCDTPTGGYQTGGSQTSGGLGSPISGMRGFSITGKDPCDKEKKAYAAAVDAYNSAVSDIKWSKKFLEGAVAGGSYANAQKDLNDLKAAFKKALEALGAVQKAADALDKCKQAHPEYYH